MTILTDAMQMPTTHQHLKQRHFLFGSRELTLKGGDSLLVRERSLARQHETVIPLNLLHASPTYSSSFAVKWLLNSLFMGTLGGMMFFWAQQYALPALHLLGAILAVSTGVMLYRFFLYTTRLVIFRHSGNNENLLYLWRDKPNKKQFEGFLATLTQAIREQQQTKPTGQPQALTKRPR